MLFCAAFCIMYVKQKAVQNTDASLLLFVILESGHGELLGQVYARYVLNNHLVSWHECVPKLRSIRGGSTPV